MRIAVLLYVLFVVWILSVMVGCTTTHSVYVSNGAAGRAGPKATLDATADITSEIIGVKHDNSMVKEVELK